MTQHSGRRFIPGTLCLLGLVACGTTVPLQQRSGPSVTGIQGVDLGNAASPAAPGTLPQQQGSLKAGQPPSSTGPLGSPAQSAAPAQGVPGTSTGKSTITDTSPVLVGVLKYGDPKSFTGATGADSNTSVSGGQALDAVISGLNRHGGLNGRQIKTVSYEVSPTSTSYDTDLAAACAKFTQDNHVAFVVALAQYYSDPYESCLSKAGVAVFEAGFATPDRDGFAKHPALINPTGLSVDRRLSAMINLSVSSGWLTKNNRLGVIVDNCPYNDAAYKRVLLPLTTHLGLPVERFDASCYTGFGAAGNLSSSVQSALLKFRSDGVNRVMTISNVEALFQLVIVQTASGQQWHPGYIVSSAAGVPLLAANYPKDQLPQIHGAGWEPTNDITQLPAKSAAQKTCLGLVSAQGIRPTTSTDLFTVYSACDALSLARAALGASAGQTTATALRQAVDSLGTSLTTASNLGSTRFENAHHDGPFQAAPFSYRNGNFVYTGAPRDLP